jgi:hypothetical protein
MNKTKWSNISKKSIVTTIKIGNEYVSHSHRKHTTKRVAKTSMVEGV